MFMKKLEKIRNFEKKLEVIRKIWNFEKQEIEGTRKIGSNQENFERIGKELENRKQNVGKNWNMFEKIEEKQ